MTRKVLYLTGSRADYGLMRRTLFELEKSADFELSLCVTGSHLDSVSGHTVNDIENDGFRISKRIEVGGAQRSGFEMGVAFAGVSSGFAELLNSERPDIVLLLGDRYEMLAAAAVTVMQNIALAHIHGGERSGTVDELFRHAISKLSHIHLVATEESRDRLVRMGEAAQNVTIVGAPGLDEIIGVDLYSREEICRRIDIPEDQPFAVIVFHPVVQETSASAQQIAAVVSGVSNRYEYALVQTANTDPGGLDINDYLVDNLPDGFRLVKHLPRRDYLSAVARADVMVGNSSSGIIEAASLSTWVVNVGSRQDLREQSLNVVNTSATPDAISTALADIGHRGTFSGANVYGDGRAASKICDALQSVCLGPELLAKQNAY